MSGETIVMKDGRTLYYFNEYYRTELKEASAETWEEILASVSVQ